MPVPRGCNQCVHCRRISPVYALFPTCRDCSEETCPDCQEPGSLIDPEDGEHEASCLCRPCAEANDRELIALVRALFALDKLEG